MTHESDIYEAIKNRNTDTAINLIQQGIQDIAYAQDKKTLLHIACKYASEFNASSNDILIVKLLIEHGCDINAQDWSGNTPLHIACEGGSIEVVTLLIKNNADAFILNKSYNGPLHVACAHGFLEVAKVLVDNSYIDIHGDNGHEAPLYVACFNGHVQIAQWLVSEGAIINTKKSHNERTPLYAALKNHHTGIVDFLVLHGADIEDRTLLEIDNTNFIKTLLFYKKNYYNIDPNGIINDQAHDIASYWLAATNQLIRWHDVRENIIGLNDVYDQAVEATKIHKMFKSSKPGVSFLIRDRYTYDEEGGEKVERTTSSRPHAPDVIPSISEDEAMRYINSDNSFIRSWIKNKLFLNNFQWCNLTKDGYVFNEEKFAQITHLDGIKKQYIDLVRLTNDVANPKFPILANDVEFSCHVSSMLMHYMADNKIEHDEKIKNFNKFYNYYSKAELEGNKLLGLIDYIEYFAAHRGVDGLDVVQHICDIMDDENNTIFNAAKKAYNELEIHTFDGFKSSKDYACYKEFMECILGSEDLQNVKDSVYAWHNGKISMQEVYEKIFIESARDASILQEGIVDYFDPKLKVINNKQDSSIEKIEFPLNYITLEENRHELLNRIYNDLLEHCDVEHLGDCT